MHFLQHPQGSVARVILFTAHCSQTVYAVISSRIVCWFFHNVWFMLCTYAISRVYIVMFSFVFDLFMLLSMPETSYNWDVYMFTYFTRYMHILTSTVFDLYFLRFLSMCYMNSIFLLYLFSQCHILYSWIYSYMYIIF